MTIAHLADGESSSSAKVFTADPPEGSNHWVVERDPETMSSRRVVSCASRPNCRVPQFVCAGWRCGGQEECGIICGEWSNAMLAVMEQIDRMTTEEKFKTMDYIWSSLSVLDEVKFPAWHERELKATEERVAAGVERPIPWKTARAFLVGAV